MSCPSRVATGVVRRPGNVMAVEAGTFGSERCLNKQPSEWRGRGASSLRWIASGGEATVFGHCTPNACPHPDLRGKRIALEAAELLATQALPEPSLAEAGAVPQRYQGCSDTCAAYESDDVHYVSP